MTDLHPYDHNPLIKTPARHYPDSLGPQVNVSRDKQQRLLDIVDRWKTYQVDIHTGTVFRTYRNGMSGLKERKINHYINEAGRPNFHIHYSFGNEGSDYEVISCFHFIWLIAHGIFEPRLKLKPIDGNWLNYRISNITLDLPLRNEAEDAVKALPLTTEFKRKVRYAEIQEIKGILAMNPNVRPIEVSRLLKLNYFSTQRAMDRIRRGLKLRFEVQGPYRQVSDPYKNITPGDLL